MGTGSSKTGKARHKVKLGTLSRERTSVKDSAITTRDGRTFRDQQSLRDGLSLKRGYQEAKEANEVDEIQPSTETSWGPSGRALSPKTQVSSETTASPTEHSHMHKSNTEVVSDIPQSPHQGIPIQHAASFGSDIVVPGIPS